MDMKSEVTGRLVSARVFPVFFVSLLVALVGVYAGSLLPPRWVMPLALIEVGMILFAMLFRRRHSVGYPFLFTFTFISGMTLAPIILAYTSTIGASEVLNAFCVTVFAFGGAALYASRSKADFRFLGGFLFIGLLALLAMGVVSIFSPFSSTAAMVYSLLGIAIFIGYTLFDVNRLTRYGVAPEDVPMVVLSLYLDFVNLFLFVLRFFGVNLRSRN